jgi:hypothetical protein
VSPPAAAGRASASRWTSGATSVTGRWQRSPRDDRVDAANLPQAFVHAVLLDSVVEQRELG